MACASSLLPEEQFQCSICLDVFNNPVTTPCGHNYCKACITLYWDRNDKCQCPVCNKLFDKRPDLSVNTLFSEMLNQSHCLEDTSAPEQQLNKPGEVSCDVCSGTTIKALKSCLVCQASYCETHLEPHRRVAGLRKHKLMDPVGNVEDRMCKKHERLLELFCKTDQVSVCQFCTETDHKLHHVVPLKDECEGKKARLGKTEAEVRRMIQERQLKIQEMEHSVEFGEKEADREIACGVQVFTALVAAVERSQAELVEVIQEKQKATKKQVEGFIQELQREIAELKTRSTKLEQLEHTEDHLHLLQSFPSLSAPPPTKDWTNVNIHPSSYVGMVRGAVAGLEEDFGLETKKILHAVDVTLDPDTAHPYLVLSEDGKQVYCGIVNSKIPDNPGRFAKCSSVLGKQSLSSGRFYCEVQVKGKTKWDLGVARESVNRKGAVVASPTAGFWVLSMRNGNEYKALADPDVLISLREKPQKVGVFVDYEEGLVSFYDVETKAHIYSFTGCTFTEKLYPYFSPCTSDGGINSAPLIISPVIHTERREHKE